MQLKLIYYICNNVTTNIHTMKRLILILFILSSVQSFGQNWDYQYGKPHSFYNGTSLKALDDHNVVAVNAFGDFFKTTNGGTTWSVKKITNHTTSSLFFYDANNGWIADWNGGIHHTTDGGTTWINQSINVSARIENFEFISATTGWGVGTGENSGVVFKTTDGGNNWIQQTLENPATRFTSVDFADNNTGYILGNGRSPLYKTTDGGNTWFRLPNPNPALNLSFNTMQFVNAETGFISDQFAGELYKTIDGGQTWQYISTPVIGTFQSFYFVDANLGYTTDDQGGVFKTTDSGNNWSQLTTGFEGWTLNAVSFSSATTGYALGGKMIKTTDGGATWSLAGDNSIELTSVFPADHNNVYATGRGGNIIYSSNGGTSWDAQTTNTVNKLNTIFFNGTSDGWAAGENGTIIKTTDGGSSGWTVQTSGTSRHLNGIDFVDANTGWAVGDTGTIISSTDGGNNWSIQTTGVTNNLTSVSFADATHGWAVGKGGVILKYDGTNWTTQTSGITTDLNAVSMVNSTTGYAVGPSNRILKTTDGGTNWTNVTSGLASTATFSSVYFTDANNGWVTSGNVVLRTINGGTNWTRTLIPGSYSKSIRFSDNDHGWIAASQVSGPTAVLKYVPQDYLQFSIAAAPVTSFNYTTSVTTFTVTAYNADGTINTSFSDPITVSLASGGGTLSGTFTQNAVNGVASFSGLQVSRPGTYTLKAISSGNLLGYSNPIRGNTITATKLVFARVNPIVRVNISLPDFRVAAQDANHYNSAAVYPNTSITISKLSGPGNISGTLTKTSSSGIATFNDIKFDAPGEYVLQATDGTFTATSITIIVGATQLVFTDLTTDPVNEDTEMPSFYVKAVDADNAVDTTFSGTITLAKISGSGTVSGTISQTAVKGIAAFDDIVFDAADSYVLEAQSGTLTDATSNSITVQSVTGLFDAVSSASSILRNMPNPFSEQTSIVFTLSNPGNVVLEIVNISGEKQENIELGFMHKGGNQFTWTNGSKMSPGIYYYHIISGAERLTNKMVIIR